MAMTENLTQEHPRTVILVPTYNEIENLQSAISAIHTHAPTVDILVIDDQSPDGTGALADEIAG